MMASAIVGFNLGQALIDEGLDIPPDCRGVELLMPADGVIRLRYEVNVNVDDLPKIARVLMASAKANTR